MYSELVAQLIAIGSELEQTRAEREALLDRIPNLEMELGQAHARIADAQFASRVGSTGALKLGVTDARDARPLSSRPEEPVERRRSPDSLHPSPRQASNRIIPRLSPGGQCRDFPSVTIWQPGSKQPVTIRAEGPEPQEDTKREFCHVRVLSPTSTWTAPRGWLRPLGARESPRLSPQRSVQVLRCESPRGSPLQSRRSAPEAFLDRPASLQRVATRTAPTPAPDRRSQSPVVPDVRTSSQPAPSPRVSHAAPQVTQAKVVRLGSAPPAPGTPSTAPSVQQTPKATVRMVPSPPISTPPGPSGGDAGRVTPLRLRCRCSSPQATPSCRELGGRWVMLGMMLHGRQP